MTTLEKLRKNFQKMHGYRRELLCELLSIRRKTRRGRQGAKDYDKNWAVVRDVLQEGVSGLEAVVNELNKALDAELCKLNEGLRTTIRKYRIGELTNKSCVNCV